VNVNIGLFLAEWWETPNDDVARSVLQRIQVLRLDNPQISRQLWNIVRRWAVPSVDREIARQMREGNVDAQTILTLLNRREKLAPAARDAFVQMLAKKGVQRGIAAIVLRDRRAESEILDAADTQARCGLLACARLIREELPVDRVAPLLARKQVAVAAESNLE